VRGVIIKRGILAEREDDRVYSQVGVSPYELFDEYKNAYNKTDSVSSYKFTTNDLKKYTEDIESIRYMLRNPNSIRYYLTKEQLENLLTLKRRETLSGYVELNNYYRTLMGLPNITWNNGAPKIDDTQIIYSPKVDGVDSKTPIHRLSKSEQNILRNLGVLDVIYETHGFEWIKYLGLEIDIMKLRTAKNFDIVYSDYDIPQMDQFVDLYRDIRNNYMVNYYKEYDVYQYQFYEPTVCLHLIMTALAAVNADSIFSLQIDEKDLYTLFESFGLPKFKFNKSYLLKLASKINTLLENKGTNYGLDNISKIFDSISIFKYFLIKKLKFNGANTITADTKNEDKYDLFFVRAPLLEDDVFKYSDKEDNLIPFNKVVEQDPLWGFEDDNLEKELMNEDFSFTESKYLTLENKVNIVTFSLECAYFYRYVIEHEKQFGKINFYLDTVDKNANLLELITYLQVLVFRKYQIQPDIPDNMNSVLFLYAIKNKVDYTKVKRHFKEHFKWHNDPTLRQNIDDLIDILDGQNVDFKQALDIFETNYNVIQRLYDLRKKVKYRDDYDAITSAIRAISYGEKIPELYNNKTNLEEFLFSYTPEGNKFRLRLLELENSPEKIQAINHEITEMINQMRSYIIEVRHRRIANIFNNMQNMYSDIDLIGYLEEIINFFKSYTQDLISRGFTYVVDDLEDQLQITERITLFLELEDWEVVLLSSLMNKYNKELVTLISEGLFSHSETIIQNESITMIDKYSGISNVGESVMKLL
jgi:hypothetical protein